MGYCPRPSTRGLRSDDFLDDRPARQRARARPFRFGGGDEAIVVVRRHELDDRGLVPVGIDTGDMREVDLELGIEVEHARARGRGEGPDGRAVLVGPEQAAERRRDAAHGRIHERERLTCEALQILEPLALRRPPPANATCAIVGAIAALSSAATTRRAAPGPRATPAAPARAGFRGRFLLRSQLLDHVVSRAYSSDACVSAACARLGHRRAFFSGSAAIIASMTRSETPRALERDERARR